MEAPPRPTYRPIPDSGLVRWRAGERRAWRLLRLTDQASRLFPWLNDQSWLDQHAFGEQRLVAVLGEGGSGLSSLVAEIRRHHAAYGFDQPPVVLDARTDGEDWSAKLRRTLAPPSANDHVSVRLVVLHHLEYLQGPIRTDTLAYLRGLYEAGETGLRVLLIGQDDEVFEAGPYSSVVGYASLYRPPLLTREEVRLMAGNGPFVSDELVEQAMDWTGGHPMLTREFLNIAERTRLPTHDVGPELRDRPPLPVNAWQRRLAQLVTDPEVQRLARAFTDPQRPWAPNSRDVPNIASRLFLSGWLSFGRRGPHAGEDRWSFPRCQQAWARPVLRYPAPFLKGGA